MVNVFILNLLGAALCAVITSITLAGLKGKAILRRYFSLRGAGQGDGEDVAMMAWKGAITAKTGMPAHKAAHDLKRRLTTPKSFKRRQKTL
jgi:hypothetical protein